MKKSKFIKAATLASFILLMIAFIIFRIGGFRKIGAGISTKRKKAGDAASAATTVPNSRDSSANVPAMFSSSKSLILIEKEKKPEIVLYEKNSGDDRKSSLDTGDTSYRKEINLMGSSKSIILYPIFKIDSIYRHLQNK